MGSPGGLSALGLAGLIAVSLASCSSAPGDTASAPAAVAPAAAPMTAATGGPTTAAQNSAPPTTTTTTVEAGATPASRAPAGVPMPNPQLTPGAIQSSDTAAICTPGWASAHRHVSSAAEDAVAARYGLASHEGYEIDHLIPLELGGSNGMANLWPEPYYSAYGATQKDGLEDWLHEHVCNGSLALAVAQHEIATNWYAAWQGARKPLPSWFGYSNGPGGGGSGTSVPPTTGARRAWCSASARPSSDGYADDYDVYIHSDQPGEEATASDGGDTWRNETDSSGYAEVSLWHTSPGEQISLSVGAARCSATAAS